MGGASLGYQKSPNADRTSTRNQTVQDQATLQAIQLVSRAEHERLTVTDHRRLRELARQASEESRCEYWPRIWGEFAEHFDPR